jgi:hypothetical protein
MRVVLLTIEAQPAIPRPAWRLKRFGWRVGAVPPADFVTGERLSRRSEAS